MKLLRKILVGLLALVLVAVVALYAVSEWKLRSAPKPAMASLAKPTAAQLAEAPRQLHVLGCLSCHGDKLQGDAFLDDAKIARLYAPNLTVIAARVTDEQLDQAIRQGIGHDGRPLLVMPSEGYQVLTDQEVAAIIAAIRTYPKSGTESPSRSIGPLGRLGIVLGKFRTVPSLVAAYRASPAPDYGPQTAAGRHIVQANCTECHGTSLKGQEVEPGVVSADLSIVGAYDLDQFKRLLREGVPPSGKDIGLMGRIARSDFKHMTDEEIAAVHAYLVENAQRAH